MKKLLIVLLSFWFFPVLSSAHGPTPQKAKESLTINAPADKVWDKVKAFGSIADWHDDIQKSEGDGKLESGGKRTLTFANGEQLIDELDYYNDENREYSYRLNKENVKALPISSYSVELQVFPGDTENSSVVTLKSRFYRGDTGNTPPEHLNDEAAVKAMTAYFKNGLASLKKHVEN
ncbi:MAG: hypothetical protein Kow0065_12540 [Methylomicrobium sp.]